MGYLLRLTLTVSLSAAATGLSSAAAGAANLHDQQVFFENSAAGDAYYHSSADFTAPSTLVIAQERIPVAQGRGTSPPNCLQLKWSSKFGGDWHARINVATRYGQRFDFSGDTLVLWCYSEEGLEPDEAPRIGLTDADGASVPAVSLLKRHGPLPPGAWTRIALQAEDFAGPFRSTEPVTFNLQRLETILLMQGLDDDRPHTLFVDDVHVIDASAEPGERPTPPTDVVAEGAERHVDVSWKASLEPSVLGYRVYRAGEEGPFQPILTRPSYFPRCVDYLGEPSQTVRYRVSAVDRWGQESPLSESVLATTRPFDDDQLLTMTQRAAFRYYWELGHADCGMALEIMPGDENLVALGASGFGIMALIVGAEREFAARGEVVERMLKIVRFLKQADRFHGVWPHFLDGRTGRVNPYFGRYDNGGDLVETAFLIQGLLAARQYFNRETEAEREIRDTITQLWQEVEWDWYRRTPDSDVLYWHWSPDHHWHIGHPLIGWNETMIVYLLAIASPTHAVDAEMYYTGWAGQSQRAVAYRRNWSRTTEGDHYTNGKEYYGFKLDVGCGNGGELFFTQFSFLGFDPRGRKDRFTNYFHNNRQIARISHAYAVDNPRQHKGYGANCWGRSAGVNAAGGRPLPRDDNGTISCSAAVGSLPYVPQESMAALAHFYRDLGERTWGAYGLHDGFNETDGWFEEVYMGLNQAQIVVMIENHRTGLVWRCFMSNPEVEPMLRRVGFVHDPAAAPQ